VAYAAVEDVENAIGADTLRAIADHDGDHVVDPTVVESALDDAGSLADTFLAGEFPIAVPTPKVLRRAVIAIAVNDMREGRDQGTEGSRLAYASAMSWLKAIADGKATMRATDPADELVDGADPGDPEATGLARMWSRESARGVF
jgi:phage gp36-like protein